MTNLLDAKPPGPVGRLKETFSTNVKAVRTALRWSQRELSAASGVSQKHIAKIESGGANAPNVRLELVEDIARALGKSPLYMLTRQRPPSAR